MMEERGLPHHLLGALGSRMQYMMQKSFSSSVSSSNNSRAQQLLAGIEAMDDEGLQLQSCIEMGQLLVMGNEDTLSGFPVKQAVPALVKLLSMEHNFDMMMNSCRALTYMMEALPRSSVVVAHAIPVLIEKLQVIQCMDVAEQALSALEILSKRHGKAMLQAGGLNASLLYLDFFSIGPQRSALSIASNCCQTVTEEDFALIQDALPILSGRLQHQDKRSVESCCLCFSRLIDSFSSNKTILQDIAAPGLLSNLQQLLVISPPIISSSMFVSVLKMLSTLCASCPSLAVQLMRLNMADTLRYLLVGAGEITLENIELITRSPKEVYEILSLTSEMMPPLPKDGVFEVEEWMVERKRMYALVQWEWQESTSTWRQYGRIESRIIEDAYQSQEDECSLTILGNTYVIDMSAMQQINEDTGTVRLVRRTVQEPNSASSSSAAAGKDRLEEDERAVVLREDPELATSFVRALFGVLYEVFNSVAGPHVRINCLKTILRILYHAESSVLLDILEDISVSSHLAAMLKAQDYRLVVGAMQMAEVLLQKLPDIFNLHFHREGVMHQLQILKDVPLRTLATPKKEAPPTVVAAPPPVVSAVVEPSASPPMTTKKRISDIFKKGKRHFRKTLRGRGDDQDSASNSSSSPLIPVGSPPSMVDRKSLPTLLPYPPTGATPTTATATSKDRIQQWIQQQATGFLEKWAGPSSNNPSHQVVLRLNEAAQSLDPKSPMCLTSLNALCKILMEPESNVSAFEFMHCKLHTKLFRFLTLESSQCQHSLNVRLRHFLHVFMGLPLQDVPVASWLETNSASTTGMAILLSKLHGCLNQLEQFPVRVNDLPGRRGSQALKFFNSHQIKCTLERHPSAVDTNQWKGGVLRIDPLATIQTLERYMIIRGFGKPADQSPMGRGSRRMDELDSEDSEVEETMIMGLSSQSTEKHSIEFFIGDHPLPYNMTIFQAVKQYALECNQQEGEEEIMPLGRPEIWVKAHSLSYRAIPSGDKAGPSSTPQGHRSQSTFPPPTSISTTTASTAAMALPTSSARKHTWSSGSSGGNGGGGGSTGPTSGKRRSSGKLPPLPPTAATPPPRVTRSSSRHGKPPFGSVPDPPHKVTRSNTAPLPLPLPPTESGDPNMVSKEKATKARLSPLHQGLKDTTAFEIASGEPSLPILRLLKALYSLNVHWTDLYPGLAGNPILPFGEFINNKLTAKATRQLQDPLNVITGNFPSWLHHIASNCTFLFPFECRQTLFYLSTFDRDRAIARLHDQQPDMSSGESSQTVTPRFEKKKCCVSRENLLEQAEKLMDELASNKALLEIHYKDEVGTGLGPTLEFYALVSRELQRSDLTLFRGDLCPVPGSAEGGGGAASSAPQYIHSPVGVFPAPLGPSTPFSVVEEVCSKFRFLGKLMAKAIMDSRMLDLPLSEAFYKWMLNLQGTFTAQDLQHVDPVVARSFGQLASVALKKHSLEKDPLLTKKALVIGIESLTLEGGGSVEDVELDFTLPGYPNIELKPGGKDIPVTIHNLDDYLKLVVDWTLVRGVTRQMEAFKEGFNTVFPLSSMQGLLYPSEMDMMICGAHLQKWDIKDLMESCRPDHGYSHDSRAIQFLFEVLSELDTVTQRQFIQFVTGSPRLPVGGFKALSPQLTIVRKTVEPPLNPDDFLPSVMTCVNYLKLPDYSSVSVMKERMQFALQEGKHSFHLS